MNKPRTQFLLETPIGPLLVQQHGNVVVGIAFGQGNQDPDLPVKPLAPELGSALRAYFEHGESLDAVPVNIQGTVFQKRVWRALSKIPLGETRTYADIAKQLNTSPRAVGNACRRNPVPVIIPCHRVVAKNGDGGFCGQTGGNEMTIKRWLLKHEAGCLGN